MCRSAGVALDSQGSLHVCALPKLARGVSSMVLVNLVSSMEE